MSVYNFFSSTAATLANRLFSFSSSAAMRANLSCSCWASHSISAAVFFRRPISVGFLFDRLRCSLALFLPVRGRELVPHLP